MRPDSRLPTLVPTGQSALPALAFLAFLAALAVLLLAFPTPSHAGAWALKPGTGKAALGVYQVAAASVVDAEGRKRSYGYEESGLFTYGEVGLLRRLSLGWAWGLFKSVASDSADARGPSDPELSLGWHFARKGSWVFALQALAQFPLGAGNPEAAPDFAPVFFSTGAHALELRPLAGWSRGPWWAQGGLGIRARTRELSPQFRYAAAAGRGFGGRFSALLSFDGVIPLDGRTNGLPGDRELYHGWHIGGDVKVTSGLDIGAQMDSMLSLGQELPLGARLGVHARWAWR